MTFKSFFHRHRSPPPSAPPVVPSAPLNPKLCYATASAGTNPAHSLPNKIEAIAGAGIGLAEVAWQDLEAMARAHAGGNITRNVSSETDIEDMVAAAEEVKLACDAKGVKVFALMPFLKFEGYEDESRRQEGLERARNWFRVMKALDCQTLLVGSNDDPDITADPDLMANDLRLLADEAAKREPQIRIAYETLAWGTYVNTWEHAADICVRVNRPNFGLCLDVFQIAAHYYKHHLELSPNSSPSSPTSPTFHPDPNPPISGHFEPDAAHETSSPAGAGYNTGSRVSQDSARPSPSPLSLSLSALSRTLADPALRDKILYLQISDAILPTFEQLETTRGSAKGKEREGSTATGRRKPVLEAWSDGWRVLPAEGFVGHGSAGKGDSAGIDGAPEGALPVLDILKAINATGWRGVWSYEASYPPLHALPDPSTPFRWARAAKNCHMELVSQLGAGKEGGAGEQTGVKVKDFSKEGTEGGETQHDVQMQGTNVHFEATDGAKGH